MEVPVSSTFNWKTHPPALFRSSGDCPGMGSGLRLGTGNEAGQSEGGSPLELFAVLREGTLWRQWTMGRIFCFIWKVWIVSLLYPNDLLVAPNG